MQAFAAKFEFVWLRLLTTVSFVTQESDFRVAKFLPEKAMFSFIVFLHAAWSKYVEQIHVEMAEKSSLQSRPCKDFHSCFVVGRTKSYK